MFTLLTKLWGIGLMILSLMFLLLGSAVLVGAVVPTRVTPEFTMAVAFFLGIFSGFLGVVFSSVDDE